MNLFDSKILTSVMREKSEREVHGVKEFDFAGFMNLFQRGFLNLLTAYYQKCTGNDLKSMQNDLFE